MFGGAGIFGTVVSLAGVFGGGKADERIRDVHNSAGFVFEDRGEGHGGPWVADDDDAFIIVARRPAPFRLDLDAAWSCVSAFKWGFLEGVVYH